MDIVIDKPIRHGNSAQNVTILLLGNEDKNRTPQREVFVVTVEQKEHVKRLRGENRSYVLIARELGLTISAVG